MAWTRVVLGGWFAALLAMAEPASAAVRLPVPFMEQPDDQTCLPTCLAMTLHWFGRSELTTQVVQSLHQRTRYDRYNLPFIVRDYGLYALPSWYELAWTPATIRAELDMGRPVILGVNQGRYGHFVLAVGYEDDGRVVIHDPTLASPGYPLGGAFKSVDWKTLLWRGGAIIRPEPFPPPPAVSVRPLDTTAPSVLRAGQAGVIEWELSNNGTAPWPEGLALVAAGDPWSSPTVERESAFYVSGQWLGPSRVALIPGGIGPGGRTRISVPVRAPMTDKPMTFVERFAVRHGEGSGSWLNESWLGGPGNWALSARIVVEPDVEWPLPLEGATGDGQPSARWQARFGTVSADSQTTPPPDGSVPLRLQTPGQPWDVAWLGDNTWADYEASAWIYCDFRPQEAPRGFERVGLFVRDNGQRRGDTKDEQEIGGCISMTYDSDDGYLRAGDVDNGGVGDFRPAPRYKITESGWHHFAIRCAGGKVTYSLDGKPFHEQKVRNRLSGCCGVWYKSGFEDRTRSQGVRFAAFKVVR
ncbi:MAG: C39 family peptidase [Candidatus Sumerlaeaceae bacterium]|nr:C39 family peptidase [Candidatus Sumerlaeaceae bacterium]